MSARKPTRQVVIAPTPTPKKAPGHVGRSVHRHLLTNPKVKAWYDERALRSTLSADIYLRQLGGICAELRLDPDQLAKIAEKDPERLQVLLVKYASDLKRKGRLDSYIGKTIDGVRSYLRSRRVQFDRFPRLSPVRGASLESERVPTQEELGHVLAGMSPRGRAISLFMAHSGLRPGVLGSYQAADGLTLADLRDLTLEGEPSFSEKPFEIRVPARLSKTRAAYTTFGGEELAMAYLGYLSERRKAGEKLTPNSPVIVADPAGVHRGLTKSAKGFLTTKAIVLELREALKAGAPKGTHWRPYVLRAYCSTRLLSAEGEGKMTSALREAILGHDTGVAGRYNVGKAWGKELLEEARAQYKRSERYLSTTSNRGDESGERYVALLQLLVENKAITGEQARVLATGSREELAEKLKTTKANVTEKRPEKAFPIAEAEQLLNAGSGWEYVGALGAEKVILRPPASISPAPPAGAGPSAGVSGETT